AVHRLVDAISVPCRIGYLVGPANIQKCRIAIRAADREEQWRTGRERRDAAQAPAFGQLRSEAGTAPHQAVKRNIIQVVDAQPLPDVVGGRSIFSLAPVSRI